LKELFEGIAEAFRQYQAEMTDQAQASANPALTGLEPETEAEKTEKRVEGNFPKRELLRSVWQYYRIGVSH
jgi:hypothetical protein